MRVIQADRDDPRVWASRGLAAYWQWDGAFQANAEALRIDLRRTNTLASRGWLLILTGRAEEALPVYDQAIALDPRSPFVSGYLEDQCYAYLLLGRYDNAISACERALALKDNWRSRASLVAVYAQKGEMAKATKGKAELPKQQPNMTIARLNRLRQSNNPIYSQQREANNLQGLCKAGIPEN